VDGIDQNFDAAAWPSRRCGVDCASRQPGPGAIRGRMASSASVMTFRPRPKVKNQSVCPAGIKRGGIPS